MMKKLLLIPLAVLAVTAFGQDTTPKQPTLVSIAANAKDVRAIIADLFAQAKVNYVLEPGVQAALFLNLDKVAFEDALKIVCNQAKLSYTVQNGIYFVSKAKPAVVLPATPPAKHGTLDKTVLTHKFSIKLTKTDIRDAFATITDATKVTIQVDPSVAKFKVDLDFTAITLKSALQKIGEAAGLSYKFTDQMSILIFKPADSNRIAISGE